MYFIDAGLIIKPGPADEIKLTRRARGKENLS
jgi:hypothetical protein